MKTIDVCFFIYNNKSDNCLRFLDSLDYPKELLNIIVFSDRELKHSYTHLIVSEREAYNYITFNISGDYIWTIYADYIIDEPSILQDLIKHNRRVISGLMIKPDSNWANFWGAISEKGWYQRSEHYFDILDVKKKGSFKVPFITGNILFKREVFKRNDQIIRQHSDWELDMNICYNLRNAGENLFILNEKVYGHIEETDIWVGVNVLENWTEEAYLHPDFMDFMRQYNQDCEKVETKIFKQLGPDIWQIPFFSTEFCDYLVGVAERKNLWSAGAYSRPDEVDGRIGTFENYPTQDVHLNQLNLHQWWLETVVKKYFKAIIHHLYKYQAKGYNIAFIVRYSEKGQTQLAPHHDASSYTTNLALNTYGVDYTGGGCNFVHKNIQVVGSPKGFLTLHPGRITHYHEAIPITSGTRYILVSFNE